MLLVCQKGIPVVNGKSLFIIKVSLQNGDLNLTKSAILKF